MQPVGQYRPDEVAGAQVRELQCERKDADRVGAELRQELDPAAQAAQQGGVGAGTDHFAGVRVEGDHYQRQAEFPCGLGRPDDDPLVAPVHAVEHADGDDRGAPGVWYLVQSQPALHDAIPQPSPDSRHRRHHALVKACHAGPTDDPHRVPRSVVS